MAINPNSIKRKINEGDNIGISDGPKIGKNEIMKLFIVVNPPNAMKTNMIKSIVDFLDLKNFPFCCFL
jgi:hypothetical protein